MKSKKLIEAVFRKENTDKIPVRHIGFSSKAASYILGREAFVGGGIQQWREAKSLWEGWHEEYLERSFKDAVDLAFATGQDWIRASYWRAPRKPTKKLDDHTYLYTDGPEENWCTLKFYPENEQASLMMLHPQALTVEKIKREVEEAEKNMNSYQPTEEDFAFEIKAQKLYGHAKVVGCGGVTIGIPIQQASIWMEAMLTDPGIVRSLITRQALEAEKNVAFLSRFGFKYYSGGLDFASEQGPMFSPKLFEDLILPGLKKVSDCCHKHDCYHLFASDGNLWSVADMLFIESGIDGYYEIDRKAGMELKRLREEYPGLTLFGNISSWTLSRGSTEDVKREVSSCMDDAKKYGGIIVGVSNYVMPEAPPENIETLLNMLGGQ